MILILMRYYSLSETRIIRFEKLVELFAVPRIGDAYHYTLQDKGHEVKIVKDVWFYENRKIEVLLDSDKNDDGSDMYIDDEELNLEIKTYKDSGWKLKSIAKNRKHRPGHR